MRKHFLFMLLLAAVPFCTSCRGDEPASSEEPDPPVRLRQADPDATPGPDTPPPFNQGGFTG